MLGDNHVVDVYISKIEAVKAAVSIEDNIAYAWNSLCSMKLSR